MDLVKDDTANDKTSPSLLSKDGDTQNDTLETEKEKKKKGKDKDKYRDKDKKKKDKKDKKKDR